MIHCHRTLKYLSLVTILYDGYSLIAMSNGNKALETMQHTLNSKYGNIQSRIPTLFNLVWHLYPDVFMKRFHNKNTNSRMFRLD